MENTTKTSSCLAITEKKTNKPGGCVGVFFQLFDWNRRSGKKKLFSKRYLPPARAKQGSRKFRADEKMPSSKLHLITDENSGGFPNMKKDSTRIVNFTKKHEMRSPSLIARLMGLESMPVTTKKACENELDKRSMKIDSRPPNLRKNDQDSEKKLAIRLGSEALPFKSVLSRSRKNYHPPKLPSPIKSPKFSLGRSAARTSRLIDAAARILEPGLQATSRAKCGIAYSSYGHHASNDSAAAGGYNSAKSFLRNNLDESCDDFMKYNKFGQNTGGFSSVYHSLPSNSGNSFFRETAQSETTPPLSSLKLEGDLLLERRREGRIFVDCDKNKIDASFDDECVVERVPLNHLYRSPLASQPRKLRKHDSSSLPFKSGNQSLNRISPVRDPARISMRSKASNLESGRISSSTYAPGGARVPTKLENGRLDMVRRTTNGREDRLPQVRTSVRKRRTTGPLIGSQCDDLKQMNMAGSKSTGRRFGFDPCSMNHYSCNESNLFNEEEAKGIHGRNKDIEFRNAKKFPNVRASATMEGEIVNKRGVSHPRKYALGEDAIGALLEQKLKELSSQEEDEPTTSFSSKRSTAIILQELIAALTADRPRSRDGLVAETNMARDAEAVEIEMSMKTSKNANQTSKNANQCSPGSVLEASFDDGFGSRLQSEIIDCSTFTDRFQLPEADRSDSASNKIGSQMLSDISLMLQTINLCGVRLTGSKLSYVEDVLLHIQLLFGNVTWHFLHESIDSLLTRPLSADELKNISDDEALEKERNSQRGFLFDCLIECLDSKYSQFCKFGFNAWTRLPARLNARKVVRHIEDEVKKWKSFSQMSLDELIELEMSRSSGKWTEFGSAQFETGAAIEQDILKDLVGEIVIDFLS